MDTINHKQDDILEKKSLEEKKIEEKKIVEEKKPLRKKFKLESYDSTGYKQIYVAVMGPVDAGKSSLVGVLTSGTLDDGNGLARSIVFKHPHEHASGRTSDISFLYIRDVEQKTLITFIDLAGHKEYLPTTINGVCSTFPDVVLVCCSDKLNPIFQEHLTIALKMQIPVIIVFTKDDMVDQSSRAKFIDQLKNKFIQNQNKIGKLYTMHELKCIKDYHTTTLDDKFLPYIAVSSKTNKNINLLHDILRCVNNKPKQLVKGFVVSHVYKIKGHGIVLSGISGIDIKLNSTLYIGPINHAQQKVNVKSIHNDFRLPVNELLAGNHGCICIGSTIMRKLLRPGIILQHEPIVGICKRFIAKVSIFHHSTTILPGYVAYINCGMVRGAVKFKSIKRVSRDDERKSELPDLKVDRNGIFLEQGLDRGLRSGDIGYVVLEFNKYSNYVEKGQKILFREGSTRGIGTIVDTIL
jgi:GTPase